MYGSTEVCGDCTVFTSTPEWCSETERNDGQAQAHHRRAVCPLGAPICGASIVVVDRTTWEPVPVGAEGVILVAGPTLSCGYKGDVDSVETGNNASTATADADAGVGAGTIAADAAASPGSSAAFSPAGHPFITLQAPNPSLSSDASAGAKHAANDRNRNRYFNTNDLGHLDAAGVLHFHGRADGKSVWNQRKQGTPAFLPRICSRPLLDGFVPLFRP